MIGSRLLPDFPSPIERDRWKNLILMRIALIISSPTKFTSIDL